MSNKTTEAQAPNYFAELNAIDVGKHTEKKNGLTYLSWAWAWAELKKRYPDSTYTVYENEKGWNYFTDDQTCWVKTGVTVNGIEHIEYLPVMDFKNKSIPLGSVTSFDVNKSIQRSLTKAVARHGLGLYIYAGEDLPEESDASQTAKKATPKKESAKAEKKTEEPEPKKSHRDLFREYLQEKQPTSQMIVQILHESGANDDSPDDVWFNALRIAKRMLG